MNPRLKTSKKWTAFPSEYLGQIKEVFEQGFKSQLAQAKLIIDGRIYTEEILLRVGILPKGHLRQANFEVSMNYSAKSQDTLERIHDCIDAAASMMNEYLEATKNDEEVDFPMHWKEYEFNERPLFLQFTTVNSDLENKADELLGQTSHEMLQELEETEDALDAADEKIAGEIDPNAELSEPSMFGKKKKNKTPVH